MGKAEERMDETVALYVKQLSRSKKETEKILEFGAMHPDLSFDNCVILYLQLPQAPRYTVHRGIAEHLEIPTDHPVTLYYAACENGEMCRKSGVFYPVPPDELPKSDRKDALREIAGSFGVSVLYDTSSDTHCDNDGRRIFVPKSWNMEKQQDTILRHIQNRFYTWFLARGSSLEVPEEKYTLYASAYLEYMFRTVTGIKNRYLPEFAFDAFPKKFSGFAWRALFLLFRELDEFIEGGHFDFYETQIFKMMRGNIYSQEIIFPERQKFKCADLCGTYNNMMLRHQNNPEIEKINPKNVHLYPPKRW